MIKTKFNKIRITGASGSGKSYLGAKISKHVGVSLTSLDELKYDFSKNYKFDDKNKRTDEEMTNLLNEVITKKKWIIEGAYHKLTKSTFDDADVIIFLKLKYRVRFFNTLNRFFKRLLKGRYEGLLNFFKLTHYNISARHKWHERELFFIQNYGDKTHFFSSADNAYDWFINQK